MKNIVRTVIPSLLGSAGTAFAAENAQSGGMSWVLIFFLAFFGLIVVMQVVPGLILFFSMLKGLFSGSSKETAAAVGTENDRSQ